MTDEELQAIRGRDQADAESNRSAPFGRVSQPQKDRTALLAEVDRLRQIAREAITAEQDACAALAHAELLRGIESYNSYRECYGANSPYCLAAVASMNTAQDIENAIRARPNPKRRDMGQRADSYKHLGGPHQSGA